MSDSPMIELEFEYVQYLRQVKKLAEGTVQSYKTYLNAVVKNIGRDITLNEVQSRQSVTEIVSELRNVNMQTGYTGNCQSALNAYREFVAYSEKNVVIYPEEAEFSEGQCVEVNANRYERSSSARAACIKFHKPICKVCSLDFSKKYGEIGVGFIHVHHLVPISEVGENYIVDPINDLVPVCPNCHAMLHTKCPPYTVEELQRLISGL